jgi:superfamily II DNA/RNA helicase
MRNWSHDDKDPDADQQGRDSKRRRTRSMDAKEEEENETLSLSMTPEEWRKEHNITVRGHGKYHGEGASAFPAPFLKFTDAPFNSTVLRSFEQAGFKTPTPIQSQVRIIAKTNLHSREKKNSCGTNSSN